MSKTIRNKVVISKILSVPTEGVTEETTVQSKTVVGKVTKSEAKEILGNTAALVSISYETKEYEMPLELFVSNAQEVVEQQSLELE